MTSDQSCPICEAHAQATHELCVLGRHDRALLRCVACGHCFFPSPDWLEEAYETAIASTDVGLVDRSIRLANITTAYLLRYPTDGSVLDYAAGTGLMVRLLRDRGFDARYFDLYGPNHLARGFEVGAESPERYGLITAIEVAEHLVDPVADFTHLTSLTDAVLFTTTLASDDQAPPPDWDYFSLGTGQHVSFFSPRSLRALADRLGYHVVSRGDIHLLSRRPVSSLTWRLITTNSVGHMLTPLRRRHSLVARDHARSLEVIASTQR